jgi:hypothetical protein
MSKLMNESAECRLSGSCTSVPKWRTYCADNTKEQLALMTRGENLPLVKLVIKQCLTEVDGKILRDFPPPGISKEEARVALLVPYVHLTKW